MLSFAAVAGCAGGGGMLSAVRSSGTDGAAHPTLDRDSLQAATSGNGTVTLGDGYTMQMSTVGTTMTTTMFLNGVSLGSQSMTVNASANTVTASGAGFAAPTDFDLSQTSFSYANLVAASNGTVSGSVNGNPVAGSVALTQSGNNYTVNANYNGALGSGTGSFSPTGGGSCHACPLVGVHGGVTADAHGGVEQAFAVLGFLLSCFLAGVAVASAPLWLAVLACVAVVIAAVTLIYTLLT